MCGHGHFSLNFVSHGPSCLPTTLVWRLVPFLELFLFFLGTFLFKSFKSIFEWKLRYTTKYWFFLFPDFSLLYWCNILWSTFWERVFQATLRTRFDFFKAFNYISRTAMHVIFISVRTKLFYHLVKETILEGVISRHLIASIVNIQRTYGIQEWNLLVREVNRETRWYRSPV